MILPVTLSMAAAAALINIWLAIRVAQARTSEKVSIGDGGNERVICRMRAHANFVEYTPFVLILIAAIELTGKLGLLIAIVGGIYMLGRVAHGIGMDGGALGKGRSIGTIITLLTLLFLAGIATGILLGLIA